jgi:hypothetical protein
MIVNNLVKPILLIESSNFSLNLARDGGAVGFIGMGLNEISI